MSGHAILKNLYEKKIDVILTISLKITAEIEIRKHVFCVLLRGVSALSSKLLRVVTDESFLLRIFTK